MNLLVPSNAFVGDKRSQPHFPSLQKAVILSSLVFQREMIRHSSGHAERKYSWPCFQHLSTISLLSHHVLVKPILLVSSYLTWKLHWHLTNLLPSLLTLSSPFSSLSPKMSSNIQTVTQQPLLSTALCLPCASQTHSKLLPWPAVLFLFWLQPFSLVLSFISQRLATSTFSL